MTEGFVKYSFKFPLKGQTIWVQLISKGILFQTVGEVEIRSPYSDGLTSDISDKPKCQRKNGRSKILVGFQLDFSNRSTDA